MISSYEKLPSKQWWRATRVPTMALLLAVVMQTTTAATFPGALSTAFVTPNKSHIIPMSSRRRQRLPRMQPFGSSNDDDDNNDNERSHVFNGIPSFNKINGMKMNPLNDFDNDETKKNGAFPTTKKAGVVAQDTNIPSFPNSQTLAPLSSHVMSQLPNGGRITLVGSGPGDPSLLTVAADRLLRDPNVIVIADRLVSDEIMDLLATSNVHVARKWPGCAEQAQEEIYHWTYQALLQGRHVVRLKIGDPFVFGRGAEEVLTFRKWGVEPKVIPVRVDSYIYFDLHFCDRNIPLP